MSTPAPDGPSPQDEWLQAIGVSRDILAPGAQVLPAGTSISALAPPAKSPPPAAILVSIDISVPAPLEPNGQQQLGATGRFFDGKNQNLTSTVKWSSSEPNVTVAPGGLAKVGDWAGKVTITATAAGGKVSRSIDVLIRRPLEKIIVSPQDSLVEHGQRQGLTATAVFADGSPNEDITDKVVWKSSKPKVVDFDLPGWCVPNEAGTALVTATDAASQIYGSTKITVPPVGRAPTLSKVTISPLNPDIKNAPVPFKAMGAYADGSTHEITDKVTWKSSDEKILVINRKGVATARLVSGTALISGIDPTTNFYQSTTCYVEPSGVKSITVSPKNISVVSGDAVAVIATATLFGGGTRPVNDLVQWSIVEPNVAAMLLGGGQVRGRDPGRATIDAFEPTSKSSDTLSITVLPPELRQIMVFPAGETIPIGGTLQFTAKGFFSDGSTPDLTTVTWSASPPGVVDIDSTGEVTAKKAGTVKITAEDPTTRGKIEPGSVELTVQ